jgi:hypothetical protein
MPSPVRKPAQSFVKELQLNSARMLDNRGQLGCLTDLEDDTMQMISRIEVLEQMSSTYLVRGILCPHLIKILIKRILVNFGLPKVNDLQRGSMLQWSCLQHVFWSSCVLNTHMRLARSSNTYALTIKYLLSKYNDRRMPRSHSESSCHNSKY